MAHKRVELFGEDGQPISSLYQYVDKNIRLFAYAAQFGVNDTDDTDLSLIEQEVAEPKQPEIYAYFQSGTLQKYSFETRCRFTEDRSRIYFYVPSPLLMEDKDITITYSVKRGKTEISLYESRIDIRPHKQPIYFSAREDLEEVIEKYEAKLNIFKKNMDSLMDDVETKFIEYDDVFSRVDVVEDLLKKETAAVHKLLDDMEYELDSVKHSLDDYSTVEDTEKLKKYILETIDDLENKYLTLAAFETYESKVKDAFDGLDTKVDDGFAQNDTEHEELRARIEEAHTLLEERIEAEQHLQEQLEGIQETIEEYGLRIDDLITYDMFKAEIDRRSDNDLALTQRINEVQSNLVSLLDESIEEVETTHLTFDDRIENLENKTNGYVTVTEDFNLAVKDGFYIARTDPLALNSPIIPDDTTKMLYGLVWASQSGSVRQEVYYGNQTFIRERVDKVWGEWEEVSADEVDLSGIETSIQNLSTSLETKANKTDVDTALADKVDTTTLTTALSSKADVSALESKADKTDLDTKANVSDLDSKADKEAVTTSLASKVDKTDLDTALSLKADKTDLDSKADADTVTAELAKKVDSDTLTTELDKKADKTSLDAKANKTDVDTALSLKADASALEAKADKTALDGKVDATTLTEELAKKADATHTHSDLETSIQTLTNSLDSKADSATLTEELAKKADADGDITGNAGTASALEMARKITFKGDVVGSLDFDGSDDVEVEIRKPTSFISVSNTNNYPYHRFAYSPVITEPWKDMGDIFIINSGYLDGYWGIFKAEVRTNEADQNNNYVSLKWLIKTPGLPTDAIKACINNVSGNVTCDLYYVSPRPYLSVTIQKLSEGGRAGFENTFTLIDSKEASGTTVEDKKDSVESYASFEEAATELNKPFTDIGIPSETGAVNSANKLKVPRNISLTGDIEGSVDFDGSQNVNVEVRKPCASIGVYSNNLYPYHRFAHIEDLHDNQDVSDIFTINCGDGGDGFGIFRVHIRGGMTLAQNKARVEWLIRSNNLPVDSIQMGFNNVLNGVTVDLYFKSARFYNCATIQRLHSSGRWKIGDMPCLILVDSCEVNNTTEIDKKDSYEVYTSVESASEELTRPITNVILATETGMVSQVNPDNIYTKRMIYRGKFLGAEFTEQQKAAIQNGTFDDLCIGDYWKISGKTYRIADINYYYGTGYNPNNTGGAPLNKHHLVIQCDVMETCSMNPTDTTAGGFLGSNMYTAKFPTYRTTIEAAFGDSVLKHWVFQTNAVTDGHPSGIIWTETDIDLMTEEQVYGTSVMRPRSPGTSIYRDERIGCQQLALYALKKHYGNSFWLKDVVSASSFAFASSIGLANYWGASVSNGDVRPIFCIG